MILGQQCLDGNHRGYMWYDNRGVSLWLTITGATCRMMIGVSVHE